MVLGRAQSVSSVGGSSGDHGLGISVAAGGCAYVIGTTYSSDYPTTADAIQRSCGGCTSLTLF